MSQDFKNKSNEEIDLIIFFNYFGEKLSNLFSYISQIFKEVLGFFISFLAILFKSWKIVLGVLVLSAILGFVMEKRKATVYESTMLVEPYFDSKYELVTNINYFNALVSNKDYNELESIFNVDKSILKTIHEFKIEPGPETENDRILKYRAFKEKLMMPSSKEEDNNNPTQSEENSIKTVSTINVKYEDFIDNRSIYAGNIFLITVKASQNNIFKQLEEGIFESFRSSYSKKIMERSSKFIELKRKNLNDKLKQIDALKTIYIDVLKEKKSSSNSDVKIGDKQIAFSSDAKTREYELLTQELAIKDELRKLDEELIRKNDFFDVITGFQKVGNSIYHWSQKYRFIYPILAFLALCGFYIGKRIVQFTINYEK